MKEQLHVYPDYCSSGLWFNGANYDPDEFNIPPMTKLALKYWHVLWEQWDIDMPSLQPQFPSKQWINGFYREWWEDGKVIAQSIQDAHPELDVVYMADTPEEIEQLYYGEKE